MKPGRPDQAISLGNVDEVEGRECGSRAVGFRKSDMIISFPGRGSKSLYRTIPVMDAAALPVIFTIGTGTEGLADPVYLTGSGNRAQFSGGDPPPEGVPSIVDAVYYYVVRSTSFAAGWHDPVFFI